jgi:fluoroquinolone transport system permease protein
MGIVPALAAAVEAAPAAPLYALFVAGFAANKVQGFALLKGVGVLTWPPVIAWFVSSPWQVAFGLDPLYWPLKLFWMLEAGEPRVWLYFLAGLAYQSLLIALLVRRFKTVITR